MTLKKLVEDIKFKIYSNQDKPGWDQEKADDRFCKALRKKRVLQYDPNDIEFEDEWGKIEFYQDDTYFYVRNIK